MSVLIFAEQRDGQFRKPAFEAVTTGRKIAEATGTEPVTVVIGSGMKDKCSELGPYGAGKVVCIEDPKLEPYTAEPVAEALKQVAEKEGARVILLSASSVGRDVAPRLTVKLQAGLAIDITDYEIDGDTMKITRPVYAGKAFLKMKINADVQVLVLRPNVFGSEETSGEVNVESFSPDIPEPKVVVKEQVVSESKKLELTEADIVVSGGRGLKGPENWNLITDLAEALGAAQGALRAVVDAGWRPHDEQVGQTGKTVTPQLYIACGISGAIQHLAGMTSSKYIVAINKDPEAPIFKVSDYGLVGDAFELLPALTGEIKKLKAS